MYAVPVKFLYDLLFLKGKFFRYGFDVHFFNRFRRRFDEPVQLRVEKKYHHQNMTFRRHRKERKMPPQRGECLEIGVQKEETPTVPFTCDLGVELLLIR